MTEGQNPFNRINRQAVVANKLARLVRDNGADWVVEQGGLEDVRAQVEDDLALRMSVKVSRETVETVMETFLERRAVRTPALLAAGFYDYIAGRREKLGG